MSTTLTILCIMLLILYVVITIFWIIRSVIDFFNSRESQKRSAEWEAERRQLERDRAIRDAEYHTARMKEFEIK